MGRNPGVVAEHQRGHRHGQLHAGDDREAPPETDDALVEEMALGPLRLGVVDRLHDRGSEIGNRIRRRDPRASMERLRTESE